MDEYRLTFESRVPFNTCTRYAYPSIQSYNVYGVRGDLRLKIFSRIDPLDEYDFPFWDSADAAAYAETGVRSLLDLRAGGGSV